MDNFKNIPQTSEQVINQGGLLIRTFGLNAIDKLFYKPAINSLVAKLPKGETIPSTGKVSYFNRPVFSNLVFKARDYYNNDNELVTTWNKDVVLDTVLFDVGQTKNIVTTQVQGRNGTIKEYISDGDFAINIKGLLVSNTNNQFPYTQYEELLKALYCNTEIEINSWILTELYGIKYIVIQNFEILQEVGKQTTVPFEIQALSDIPTEIILK
jgi:hypothetical protein